MLDRHDDGDAGRLTPAQQDRVVEQCFHCARCSLDCPYVPALHPAQVDFPRLMLRAEAMRFANGHLEAPTKTAARSLGRPDRVGRVGTRAPAIANRVAGAPAGSVIRRTVSKVTGVSAVRLLPPFARQRFSTWFRERAATTITDPRGRVTVFPTCLVEYHEPAIGADVVAVLERNRIECSITAARCCGAPLLHSGDLDRFRTLAAGTVSHLAADIRAGTDVVVAQPTCSHVLKEDYPTHVPGPDADLVAARTSGIAEHLMGVHSGDGTGLAVDFPGRSHRRITYHVPCHVRARDGALASRDLMELTGAEVVVVERCSGMDGSWGLRAGNEAVSVPMARELGARIDESDGDAVAGDCHLANTAILEQTGERPAHPVQVMARAYGISQVV
jgi:Fe-S oxidoreductase